jgi:hypothetical protein
MTATDQTQPDARGAFVAPIDSHCHVTRVDSEIPCVRRAHDDDVHEDPDGTEYRTVALTEKGGRRG